MVAVVPVTARRVATLLVDNYDSYTFNIFQMLAQVNGAAPVVVKNDAHGGDWAAAWRAFLRTIYGQDCSDGLPPRDAELVACNVVISPGPGHPSEPQDFGMCADAIRHAPVPVLGVCLGHQGLATVYGGQVTNAPEVMHGRTSRVELESSGETSPLLAHIPDGFEVVRYHSLAISDDAFPSDKLQVLARSEGDGVIMAVEHRSRPQFGVQFHPEAVCSTFGYQLFQNFRDITLQRPPTKCSLAHSAHPDTTAVQTHGESDIIIGSTDPSAPSLQPKYDISIQRTAASLASLEFAEFAFDQLFGASKRSFWLDSSNFGAASGAQSRFSIMGDDSGPLSYCVEYCVLESHLRVHRPGVNPVALSDQDILSHLREQMSMYKDHKLSLVDEASGQVRELDSSDIPFAFRGGFVGYFGYEVIGSGVHGGDKTGAVIEQAIERRMADGEYVPDASFVFADRALVFDHLDGAIYTLSVDASADAAATRTMWHKAIASRIHDLEQAFTDAATVNVRDHAAVGANEVVVFEPSCSREQYSANIEEILRLIHEGETYEVCLTNQLRASCCISDPLGFYQLLRKRNPAPFAGFYLSNPTAEFTSEPSRHTSPATASTEMARSYAICCSSPERFLRVTDDGWMESKPIKGTRRRGRSPSEDEAIARELAQCVKDRAENMMIADLVRNDFGVVAEIGTVHVPKLMAVESYATVHQLVTTVRGKKRADADLVDILRATFPGGSMTGAPKKRTMQIIRQLERGPRGVYSGALGFLSLDGSCDLNIIIRTAVVTPHSVSLGAGGAIVAMSDTEDEYEEMLLKARALVQAIGKFVTGRDDGTGARVESSASSAGSV